MVTPTPAAAARDVDPAVGAVLSSAESFFRALKTRDATAAWSLITEKSRATIVEETTAALAAAPDAGPSRGRRPQPSAPSPPARDAVARDFAEAGPIARAYWGGFTRRFDPDEALERSRWEIGTIDRDTAVVAITHRDSQKPAVVRMYREEGGWKVGLVETFWTR